MTLRANVAAWRRQRLRPHVLNDVREVSTEVTVLGTPVSMPVAVAPTAYHKLAHPDGEAATARGAAAAGALMTVSTLATTSLEDVAAAAPEAPRWFQLYVFKDRGYVAELVARAAEAHYLAIVLTVDAPMLGRRRRDERNSFTLPPHIAMANLPHDMPETPGSSLAKLFGDHDRGLTWTDLDWLRGLSGLPLLVKGIHRGDDAARALDHGIAGVIVSNHGGRQLDHAVATADALPEVVAAVDGRIPVLVDGGVRTGTDVVKALAIGAQAVLIGRPVLWGLAAGGADGVTEVLDGFRDELHRALTLCGVTSPTQITPDLLV